MVMQIDEVDDGKPLEPQESQPRRPAVFENIEEKVLISTPTTTPDTNIHKQHSKTICRSTIMIKIFLCQSSLFGLWTTLGVLLLVTNIRQVPDYESPAIFDLSEIFTAL